MEMAAGVLLDRGRRRIAYIGGPEDWSSERERFAGAQRRLQQSGLTLEARIQADYTFEGGAQAARKVLAQGKPDALLCANDAMALGALTVAQQEMAYAVPEDLSIVGFDDIGMASWPCFALSTVRNPIDRTVECILDLLVQRLKTPQAPGKLACIAPELVLRQTH